MTSKVDKPRAEKLRAEGRTLQEIGDEFGVSRERIRQIIPSRTPLGQRECENPECSGVISASAHPNRRYCDRTCQARAYQLRTPRRVCPMCSGPKAASAKRCMKCQRGEWDSQREDGDTVIKRMWRDECSMAEIAEAIGTTTNALGVKLVRMRARGVDLPLRRAAVSNTEAPSKHLCRQRFAAAVLKGEIRRATRCERCGEPGHTDGHHSDYSRPLYVEWLCRSCHAAHHVAERKAAA